MENKPCMLRAISIILIKSLLRMQRLFLLSIFFLTSYLASLGQNQRVDPLNQCQRHWKYKELESSFSGTVIFFDQPTVKCGVVSTASVALIKRDNGDTIRVLTICNNKKEFDSHSTFQPGEKVTITPSEAPSFTVNIMPVDFASCRLTSAYFGRIQKIQ
jgi:hypothetical protein